MSAIDDRGLNMRMKVRNVEHVSRSGDVCGTNSTAYIEISAVERVYRTFDVR